jgi:hypothetical protein
MDRQPTARWTVKPSHRLTSMRLAALLWLAGAVSGTALLISLLR